MTNLYERVARLSLKKQLILAHKLNVSNGHNGRVQPEAEPSHERLVAYVVSKQDEHVSTSELQSFLRESLPEYMVPSQFISLDALPLTRNGKLDRKTLAARDDLSPQSESLYQPPRNETEQTIAAIWQEVLQLEKLSIHDNFFDLGGHSLLATQVTSRLQRAFQIEISAQKIFEAPTVADLAVSILQAQAQQVDDEEMARMLAELDMLPDDEK